MLQGREEHTFYGTKRELRLVSVHHVYSIKPTDAHTCPVCCKVNLERIRMNYYGGSRELCSKGQ